MDRRRKVKPRVRETVVRYMQILFTFFNEAKQRGIVVCEDYQKYDNSKTPPQNVTITDEEFEKIYLYRSSNERLENVRQLFIIACTTGLRYSDIATLQSEHINYDEGVIQRIQHKTNQSMNIALNPLLEKMLLENDKVLPKSICNQDFNRYLKELFKEIGLDRTIQISRIVGKRRVVTDYRLHEMATSKMGHLCSSLAGKVPDRTIMAMSGHHSVHAFHSYLCNTAEQEREMVMRIWDDKYEGLLCEDFQIDEKQVAREMLGI